ncbi:MAG TPA: hypothetical protein DCO75_09630 [Fibrobacteres bacterium]|jgi:K+-transporting ATPase KdpF subunit|nr:hypothetical protein [Fibrobacterota bacterium]
MKVGILGNGRKVYMYSDFLIGGVTAFLLLAYLIIAMLFPEKF